MKINNYRLLVTILFINLLQVSTYDLKAQLRIWETNETYDSRFSKIMVLGLSDNVVIRDNLEVELVKFAQKRGLTAIESIFYFPPGLGNPFEDAAQTRNNLFETGFDGLITVTIIGTSAKRYIPPTSSYQPQVYYSVFRNYYYQTYALVNTPGYTTRETRYFIEANLYEMKDGRLLWSGRSYAFDQEEYMAQIKRFAKKLFKELIKQGVITSQ